MKHRILIVAIIIMLESSTCLSQILHTESFTVILDSAKKVKGSIVPDFRFKNLKQDLFEFENISDISIKMGRNALTVANKISLSKFGDETLVSGGYLYTEYRDTMKKKLTIEYFGQVHWAEVRGMERKYAIGVNSRWRLINRPTLGVFLGIGPFYEYERWNFNGVKDENLPADITPIEEENLKWGSYGSIKYAPFEKIFLDASIYYQARFDESFSKPRLASSTRLTYQFSKHLGLSFIYQNIYDPNPIVPIDQLFNNLISGFTISF